MAVSLPDENFTLQASFAKQMIIRKTLTNSGSSSAGIYLDLNPTLPDGTAAAGVANAAWASSVSIIRSKLRAEAGTSAGSAA